MLRLKVCFLATALVLAAAPAPAQQPLNLLPPRDQVPPPDKQLLEEQSPGFNPIRPAGEGEQQSPAVQVPAPPPQAASPVVPPPVAAPVPVAPPAPVPSSVTAVAEALPMLPLWVGGLAVLAGALIAGLFGMVMAQLFRRGEQAARRRAVAATLATELETRRQAFDAVPLPPNAEAGVSFVSSVTSLAGIDAGFRSAQHDLHLLPERLAANVSVHYAAVQRVSDFVKGQSLAAAVRMLQANRIGGHPCPDAGTMREAHVELAAAFRGLDKLVQVLKGTR